MIRQYLNVMVDGSPSDVHVRYGRSFGTIRPDERWSLCHCGVYVRPNGSVPGYWYFPEGDRARAVLAALPVRS